MSKWKHDHRYEKFQPTIIGKIDIKAIIDILNYKKYGVMNFRLLSIADPKNVVSDFESAEMAKIYFQKDSRPIDNTGKPKGWEICYENGIQVLIMNPGVFEDLKTRRNAISNSMPGEREDKTLRFSDFIDSVNEEMWSQLYAWSMKI